MKDYERIDESEHTTTKSHSLKRCIDQATDGTQASENWALLIEICDVINETEDGPKDAVRAIKKKMSMNVGKNYTSVMYSLTVLETCVKNCGKRFHVQIATKDFMGEMVKVIGPKNDPPQVVQEKVLSLIQTWADAFSGSPELKEVCKIYMDLKNKGIEFPMTDLDAMAPIHTPARTANEPDPAATMTPPRTGSVRTTSSGMAPVPGAVPAPPAQRQHAPPHATVVPVPPTMAQPQQPQQPQQPPLPPGPVMLSSEQLAKLKSELDVVQQNCKLLSEMLTELTPGQEDPADSELLGDLHRTCRQMQQRIVEMIDKVQNEDVTCELLRVNDELNNVFLRYERFERLRGNVPPSSQPTGVATNGVPRPAAAPVTNQAPASTGDPAIANLIDLATPEVTQAPTSDPFVTPASTNDVHVRLADMNLGSNTVSGQLDNINSTAASTGQDDDFDMFAQSRQAFDENRQAMPGGDSYSAQQGDIHQGGLGSAVSAKNTGNPAFGKNEPSEYDEMEKWLKENPASGAPPPESATSSEFDRFLAERAREADSLPDIDAATGRTNQRAASRQIQKDDTNDNALFAL